MTETQEEKMREDFERIYLEGNKHNSRCNSTTGDYILPCINDAYAGWKASATQYAEQIEYYKSANAELMDCDKQRREEIEALRRKVAMLADALEKLIPILPLYMKALMRSKLKP